jgi:hypothetical protein
VGEPGKKYMASEDFILHRAPMISGIADAAVRTYRSYVGQSGRTWLVACQDAAADNIYVSDPNPNSQGFAGATLRFLLEDGQVLSLQGPWHSSAESLLADTGIDIRDKHRTFVVIYLQRAFEDGKAKCRGVLYKDDVPTLGSFEGGKNLAQEYANRRGEPVYCYSESAGGSWDGLVTPEEVKA